VAGASFVPGEADAELRLPAGAFVTVRRREDGKLRACVGLVRALEPLVESVARAAAAAAGDRRFDPMTSDELPLLRLEISALGPLLQAAPESVQVGLHGVVVSCGGLSGLLLPQVAVEHGFSRETFLEQACHKAGLPLDAWRGADCEIRVFTATVFSEEG
jgi:AmmeMemoRadiSam system protein A